MISTTVPGKVIARPLLECNPSLFWKCLPLILTGIIVVLTAIQHGARWLGVFGAAASCSPEKSAPAHFIALHNNSAPFRCDVENGSTLGCRISMQFSLLN